MTPLVVPIEKFEESTLAQRCALMGVPLLGINHQGRIIAQQVDDGQWPAGLIASSPLFVAAVTAASGAWRGCPETDMVALWPGCWVAPLPIRQHRRNVGYRLAMFFTAELAGSEQFTKICDEARLDIAAARSRLLRCPLPAASQIQMMARTFAWMANDIDQQQRQERELDKLSTQLGETYEELSLMYKLSANMSVTRDHQRFVSESLDEVQQVVGLRWMAMQLIDDDQRLASLRGQLIVAGDAPTDRAELSDIARRLLSQFKIDSQANIVDHPESLGIPGLANIARRLLFVPVVADGRPLAILIGAEKLDESELSSVDSKLVTSMAQNLGIFLANSMLYEDLQGMFMGTLRSLVNAIDAKDTYTCGHSERVAFLGRQLAEKAGLDPATVERLYLAGLLHDVGKIGVPEAVLTKPGRLTDEEFEIIKTHPRIGAHILQGIRQMQDLIPGVLYHHERYDGRGYPDRLAGDNIPLFGRLLCLADSFDAMSSNRTYRSALPLDQTLEEITRCAGSQFDPALANVFVTLDFAPYQQMVRMHQQRPSLIVQELGGRSS